MKKQAERKTETETKAKSKSKAQAQARIDQKHVDALLKLYELLKDYHRHEVQGVENIPSTGRCLLVFNHSLATYDMFLLIAKIFLERDRLVRPLIDRLFYRLPYVGEIMNYLGAEAGSHEAADRMLLSNEIISVAPGGMKEAIRPSQERYQIRWERRTGFVRLAIRTQSPIILCACPKADDLYDVFPSRITEWAYEKFKIPLFFAKGLGVTPVPKPVRLTHFVDKAIKPPKISEDDPTYEAKVKALHKKIVKRMELLRAQGIEE